MAKGRPGFLVKEAELRQAIEHAEQSQVFSTQGQLYEFVSKQSWAQSQPMTNGKTGSLTAQMIYILCRKHGINVKTSKGKIGGGQRPTRVPIAERKPDNSYVEEQVKQIRSYGFPAKKMEGVVKLIKRASKGSRPAAIRLHCLECVGFEQTQHIGTKESCGGCALYSLTRKD